LRHLGAAAQARADILVDGEALQIALEVNNPVTGFAVQVQTQDGHLIGWAPCYLVADLRVTMGGHSRIEASVRRINRLGAPFARRVLVELRGGLIEAVEPMTADEYEVVAF
jgi:hypothetical protein